MRFPTLILSLFAGLAVRSSFATPSEEAAEPEIVVTASFPEDNPFGQVVNGERNHINLLVENKSDQNVTLESVSGAFLDAETDAVLKNTTAVPYGLYLIQGTKLQVPYQFYSEISPGDVRLQIWLTHRIDTETYRVSAFDSVVNIVEPAISLFDYQVITTYLITVTLLGGLGYLTFNSLYPKSRKSRKGTSTSAVKSSVSGPVGTVTATGAGGYQEEWIPEHHLKKKGKTAKKDTLLSSGDELSGGETSGTETRKRKGRK